MIIVDSFFPGREGEGPHRMIVSLCVVNGAVLLFVKTLEGKAIKGWGSSPLQASLCETWNRAFAPPYGIAGKRERISP